MDGGRLGSSDFSTTLLRALDRPVFVKQSRSLPTPNFYCFGLDVRYDSNLGYGDNGKPFPRNLRLQFGKWKMYRASSVGGERPSDATGETKIFLYAARHG